MLSKSSKWELGCVHYIGIFTISRFLISKFECIISQEKRVGISKNQINFSFYFVFFNCVGKKAHNVCRVLQEFNLKIANGVRC